MAWKIICCRCFIWGVASDWNLWSGCCADTQGSECWLGTLCCMGQARKRSALYNKMYFISMGHGLNLDSQLMNSCWSQGNGSSMMTIIPLHSGRKTLQNCLEEVKIAQKSSWTRAYHLSSLTISFLCWLLFQVIGTWPISACTRPVLSLCDLPLNLNQIRNITLVIYNHIQGTFLMVDQKTLKLDRIIWLNHRMLYHHRWFQMCVCNILCKPCF